MTPKAAEIVEHAADLASAGEWAERARSGADASALRPCSYLVGARVVVPGAVFKTPGTSYSGTIYNTGVLRGEPRAWIRFDDDSLEYWFPLGTVLAWLARRNAKGRPGARKRADQRGLAGRQLQRKVLKKERGPGRTGRGGKGRAAGSGKVSKEWLSSEGQAARAGFFAGLQLVKKGEALQGVCGMLRGLPILERAPEQHLELLRAASLTLVSLLESDTPPPLGPTLDLLSRLRAVLRRPRLFKQAARARGDKVLQAASALWLCRMSMPATPEPDEVDPSWRADIRSELGEVKGTGAVEVGGRQCDAEAEAADVLTHMARS